MRYWSRVSVFCRHNRFTADCPICSKGTVLESGTKQVRRSTTAAGGTRKKAPGGPAPAFSGRYASAGPYEDETGSTYEVRLERVPGGIRLAEWDGTGLRRRAPVLAAADVPALVEGAGAVLEARDAARLAAALEPPGGDADAGRPPLHSAAPDAPTPAPGISRGRSGDFKEELRVESASEGRVRIGRWVLRPGSGWQLQEAPPMLPAARYAEALGQAARNGLVVLASDAGDAARL